MAKSSESRFRIVTDQVAGQWVKYRTTTCGLCQLVEGRVKAANNKTPDETIAAELRHRGWIIGQGARTDKDICPTCRKSKGALCAAQKQAIRCKNNLPAKVVSTSQGGVRKVGEVGVIAPIAAVPMEQKPMPAEEPRQPTREDNRRIRSALDDHYVDTDGCYAKNFSDEALAQKLNLPLAWIAKVRSDFYGLNKSEASVQAVAAVPKLTEEAKALADKFMEGALQCEALMKKIDDISRNLSAAH